MTRKVCVVTGTRADYGLLRWVMQGLKDDLDISLQIVATGMHLSPEFGLTYKAIERDGFKIDRRVEMLTSSDTPVGTAKSMGLGMIGFADVFDELRPDIIVLLGDRFEIFAAAASALVGRIPLAHIHGGELTQGAFDEALRHSITKMAQLHFVAAREYQNRVIQLGEHPNNVFMVGGLGIDNINRLNLLGRATLETQLGLTFYEKNLLITFHPTTLEEATALVQMRELLASLADLENTLLIFTMPNADTGGRELLKLIEIFVAKHANAHAFKSLGQSRYLSCLAQVDGVVGNSSSGLAEAPSFKKGTINIGNRQSGRLQATSIINCEPHKHSIDGAIKILYSNEFQSKLREVKNPYGEGGASEMIVKLLKETNIEGIIFKEFYDFPRVVKANTV